jgi:hypothetical protein
MELVGQGQDFPRDLWAHTRRVQKSSPFVGRPFREFLGESENLFPLFRAQDICPLRKFRLHGTRPIPVRRRIEEDSGSFYKKHPRDWVAGREAANVSAKKCHDESVLKTERVFCN